MIEGVIFDWAGTTVDFGCLAPVDAFYQAFKTKEIEVTEAEIRVPMGMKKLTHIEEMLKMPRIAAAWEARYNTAPTETDMAEIYDVFEVSLFKDLAKYSEVKPGTLATIDSLRQQGVKIGSTTGYTAEMMAIVAKEAAAQGYAPDVIVTPDQTGNVGRPSPYMIFQNIEQLGLASVAEVIKVGDTISDIMEGTNAGVLSVGVIEGSSLAGHSWESYQNLSEKEQVRLFVETKKAYLAAGADYVIDRLEDLPGLIESLQK